MDTTPFRRFAAYVLAVTPIAAQMAPPPIASKDPVADVYHGVSVVDEYRRLEDWSNPATREWSNAQNVYARTYLDALPARAALRDRIASLVSAISPNFFDLTERGGTLFAMQFKPPKQQAMLV